MKKLSLSALALFFQVLGLFAQVDSAAYKQRKLKLAEVNFVSAYYMQDGNNSAVTGGVGTEKLTDLANTIELKMVKTDRQERIHTLTGELGIDHYTSASSDRIDPSTISSASSADTRYYPSVAYNVANETKGILMGVVGSFSTEYDYTSYGLGVNFAKTSKDKNREIGLKAQAYFDTWTIIYPIELRNSYAGQPNRNPRNSYSASLTVAQVMNQRLQLALMADGIYQQGLLATKYQRVYFTDNSVAVENLPDTRFKFPIGIRAGYFLGDRFIIRGFYRYYMDNWGITAHTLDVEVPVKLNEFISISPFYRLYQQVAADYFAPYKAHDKNEIFYTSDYDLSDFSSHFFGTGLRYMPAKGVFGITHWAMAELRYGHYQRSNGLNSDIVTMNLGFK